MDVDVTISCKDKFVNLNYKNVEKVITINNKVIVCLAKNYTYDGPDLRDYNTSSIPFEHVFYDVVSIIAKD